MKTNIVTFITNQTQQPHYQPPNHHNHQQHSHYHQHSPLQSKLHKKTAIISQRTIHNDTQASGNQLPINFLHSPAQYTKMLIKCKPIANNNSKEVQLGIVKNLQFINGEYFVKEKEKIMQRRQQYLLREKEEQKNRRQLLDMNEVKCHCCCCDNYCLECAKESNCDKLTSAGKFSQSRMESQGRQQSYLIDIEGIKKGVISKNLTYSSKMLKKDIEEGKIQARCHQRNRKPGFRIDQLINSTLIKEIQHKKVKFIQAFTEDQRRKSIESFNYNVRMGNRSQSAPKTQEKQYSKPKMPSKKEIAQNYYQSVKDLIRNELKRHKAEVKEQPTQAQAKCHTRKCKLSEKKMQKLRVKYGQKALEDVRGEMQLQMKEKKVKAANVKKVLKQQKQIIKGCGHSKFSPSKQAIQQAFTNLA